MAYKMKGPSLYRDGTFENKRAELKSLRSAKREVISNMRDKKKTNVKIGRVLESKGIKREARKNYRSEKKEFKAKAKEVKRGVKDKYKNK